MQKIKIREIKSKDKPNIFKVFRKDAEHVENYSYSMLGLSELNENDLYERMVKAGAVVIELNETKFLGIIEVVPYEYGALEVRSALLITNELEMSEIQRSTKEFIINTLQTNGAKRIITEVSVKSDVIIGYLIKSGYKVVSIINDTMTMEFDYSIFNKK